jgi:hypothetical protein
VFPLLLAVSNVLPLSYGNLNYNEDGNLKSYEMERAHSSRMFIKLHLDYMASNPRKQKSS